MISSFLDHHSIQSAPDHSTNEFAASRMNHPANAGAVDCVAFHSLQHDGRRAGSVYHEA